MKALMRTSTARHTAARRTAALLTTTLLALSACSPGADDGKSATPTSTTEAPASPSDSASPTAPQVAKPWKEGDPQLGAQILWYAGKNESDSTVRAKSRRLVDYMVSMDMNSVSVSFPFVTRSITSDSVSAGDITPTPEHLAILLKEASASGLRITLRPTLDERSLMADDPLAWRGQIRPASRTAWFASYERFLEPYLKLAAEHKAHTFVIGTELSSMEGKPQWKSLISSAEKLFPGEIAYAVNWDAYVAGPVDVPVTKLGIDAYFPLKRLKDDAPVSAIVDGWQDWLDKKSTGPLNRVLLYEVGAPAENGAYKHPGVWGGNGGPLNLKVQQNWFEAVCQVARDREMAGLYWWKLDFHVDPAKADPTKDVHDSFLGRPAEESIAKCFRSWSGLS